jgi:hypothetical protein
MSIRSQIAGHVDAGALHEFVNPLGAGRNARRLFLSNDAFTITDTGQWDDSDIGNCFVRANSRFEAFVKNDEIHFSLQAKKKHPRTAFARVCPIKLGVVAIRVWQRSHHLRVFGCFAEKDWFVAIKWDTREDLNFREAAAECCDIWNGWFSFPPLVGASIHDYFSDRVSTLKAARK